MALKAAFIGINRYRDPNINDLSGARRDAVALHALFGDSVMNLDARLVVDTQATVSVVRAVLDDLLGAATEDDTVVFSFAGHGSPDHRIVLHDSTTTNDASMIAMSELADRFRSSQAKSIVCILDCCFSGGAPARVLDPAPLSRSAMPNLNELFPGKGRVLLAAASPTEPAWEQPGNGHGLLTKAIIDVLTGTPDAIEVGAAMDRIMAIVRAEAARIGKVQTPVRVGYVEGGFLLPPLKPGVRYAAAFPDRVGIKIGNSIHDLTCFQVPDEALTLWSQQFASGLNALQLAAVNDYRVMDGRNLLVVAPTGAGKTFIGEMAAVRAVAGGQQAVFLLPYRALVNEKYEAFSALYGERLSFKVIRCTGDYQDETGRFVRGKYDIAILTYEMFLNLTLSNQNSMTYFGLVVVDEAQFITDPSRGIVVELLLTMLLSAREEGVCPQIVALSAVIGAVNGFDKWLGAGFLLTRERPVPLIEGVIDRSGLFQSRDTDGSTKTEQFLPRAAIVQRKEDPSAQDIIVPLVRHLMQEGETVIVFRNQRGPAAGCANYLAADLGLPAATKALAALSAHDQSTTSVQLRSCLQRGVAFHNSNLTREERIAVEKAFRSEGELRVMAATTTLAAGINTPASTVILAEQEFVGEDGRPFTIAEYKNMAGRAGRPGFGRAGRAMIYSETSIGRAQLFNKYVLGEPEPVRSSFDARDMDTWILRLLSQVKQIPKEAVVKLLANTYAGYFAALSDPNWQLSINDRLARLLDEMSTLGLLDEEGGQVSLSLLGRACARSSLAFRSCLRLVDLLRRHGNAVLVRDLMMLIQSLPESDDAYTPIMPRAGVEKDRPRQLAMKVGQGIVRELQRYVNDDKDYLKRCKRSLVLLDWVEGVPTSEIESRYSPTPYQGKVGLGDIRRFADVTRFHLRAASEIARLMFIANGPSEEDTERLLRSLELGIPGDQLVMLDLPMSWTRGELLGLREMGVKTPADLWATPPTPVHLFLGEERAARLERLRP